MRLRPFDYQSLMIDHLCDTPYGGLFVGAGLGKTACVLEAFSRLRLLGLAERMLVVAPLRVAALTWPGERDKWEDFRSLKVINLRDKSSWHEYTRGDYDIATINFDNLQKMCARDGLLATAKAPDILCIDELSKCKSASSKRTNALRKIIGRFRYRWGLTGTPSPNTPIDLFAQCRVIDGGATFGTTKEPFIERWFTFDNRGRRVLLHPDRADRFHALIAERYMSLPREKYLQIPNIEEIDVPVKMSNLEEYHTLRKKFILQLSTATSGGEREISAVSAVTLIQKLRQLTVGIVYDADGNAVETDCLERYKALTKILKEEKSPVLVACHYAHEQAMLKSRYPQAVLFSEAKTQEQQQAMLAKWNAGKIPMLIANPQSMSHGLNMQTGGNVLVWHSLSYSSEQYEQMVARLARTGQDKVTKVYRLIAEGTIDETLAEVIRAKTLGQAAFIQLIHMLNCNLKVSSKAVDPADSLDTMLK